MTQRLALRADWLHLLVPDMHCTALRDASQKGSWMHIVLTRHEVVDLARRVQGSFRCCTACHVCKPRLSASVDIEWSDWWRLCVL